MMIERRIAVPLAARLWKNDVAVSAVAFLARLQ
jgi:hypothetical protein